MKTSNVYAATDGEDFDWVVDLLEDGKIIETRYLRGFNKRYAEDLSENWDTGVLELFCPDD